MNPTHLLDNIAWHSLCGPHARFALGEGNARRFADGFPAIVGFTEPQNPDFSALAAICEPDEIIFCPEWNGKPPGDWHIHDEKPAFRMVWQGDSEIEDPFPDAVPLQPAHYAQAFELAELTNPGPYGPRTPELGDYFGWFEGDRLIAMGGERLCAGPYREVSGICTHPDFRGRGLARRLTLKLIHHQLRRGETPFLHVVAENTAARQLYCDMGFQDYCDTTLRVISRD